MESQSPSELTMQGKMLPPSPGTFQDREDLITYVRDFGASQGYVVTIKKSRRDRRVILGCDRGGVYRNRRKIEESKRKRKASSRLINCPFEAIGKKEDDEWVLTIKNGEHNHEALKDMSEHPYSRRFNEEEIRQIKQMTEAGVKPRQVLKVLKQTNPDLQSTPRHLYNLKAKIRQGNLSEKSFKSWRPNRSISVNPATSGSSLKENNHPLKVPNLIGGKFVDSQGGVIVDVINPATQEVVSQVPLTTYEEFKDAVSAAKQAFPSWKNTPVTVRQRIMFKLQELIRRDIDKLAMNITIEQGKTLKGAQGDVLRGLEVVEQACGMATLQMGEFVPNASNGIDTYCIREPLGVCAGICPFNFPAMIPLWMFPVAVTCGNTFILKPCEKNPGASMILAALAMEAGLPDGVLNIVHGTHDIVNHICDDDDIKAISFVGSNTVGMHIYARAAARGKRVQSNMGAKNHAIIMPDASMDATLNYLVAAGFGAAGQRCMSLSTAVFVGGSAPWEDELVGRAKALKVNVGTDPRADVGPVISKEAKDRICRLVQSGVQSGARLILDGTDVLVPGYENGNFVGPTILCDVTSNMECYKEEIFGPVLLCMKADNLEEAITIVNKNKFSNGASIFTTSGVVARKFQSEVEAGLVGINVPVPVPLPFSSLNGTMASCSSDLNFCGKEGVQFYTQIKTVAQQWKDLPSLGILLAMPPSSNTDMTSQGGPSALPPTSETDSPSRRVSPALPLESEVDSPSRGVSLPAHFTSERDLRNPEVSSAPPTADRDLLSREEALVLPSISERDLANREMSLAMPSQGVSLATPQISERMYMPQTSQWNGSLALGSQRTETATSERIYMPTSHRSGSMVATSQRTDGAMALTSERVYVPTSYKNDNMGPMSHRKESITTSHRTDTSVHPTSERVYMLSTSHLSDDMGQTYQRNESTMFPTSERVYMPATSHRNDHMGSTSQRTDIALHPTSERIYISATSQRNENIAQGSQRADAHMGSASQRTDISLHPTSERIYMSATSQRNDSISQTSQRADTHMGLTSQRSDIALHPTSERMYLSATSQPADAMAPTSERMYMPPIAQRNTGMPPTSDRLYGPATSQRMLQNPIISMDDFNSQGASLNLPASQRL